MSPDLLYIIIGLGITVLLAVIMYNQLIALRNRYKNAFAQISVQLQRRYDLIPNLVNTAKQYMQHEKETLTKVIEARNACVNANKTAGQDPSQIGSIKALAGAETMLSRSLGSFFALSENYPDIKANQTMQQLMEELATTENKIAFARQAFNDQVMTYNTSCQSFPNSIIANLFKFQKAALLELEDKAARKAVKVDFS